jgi:hypothetical protein
MYSFVAIKRNYILVSNFFEDQTRGNYIAHDALRSLLLVVCVNVKVLGPALSVAWSVTVAAWKHRCYVCLDGYMRMMWCDSMLGFWLNSAQVAKDVPKNQLSKSFPHVE